MLHKRPANSLRAESFGYHHVFHYCVRLAPVHGVRAKRNVGRGDCLAAGLAYQQKAPRVGSQFVELFRVYRYFPIRL